MERNLRNLLLASGLFVLAVIAGGVGNRYLSVLVDPGPVWLLGIGLLGIGFLSVGAYGLVTGRVYGRTWEKYWGGWVNRSEHPGYFWSFTAMYIVGGILLLMGCRILS